MVTWADLEISAPSIAAAGRRLLWVPGTGFGYLATVRPDGGPRIHPVNVVIADGRLLCFVVPSPKLEDLQRDGRFALHSTGAENVNDEFYIAGRAILQSADPALRDAALAVLPFRVDDTHVLVELEIDVALWAAYATPPTWPPTYHRWRAAPPQQPVPTSAHDFPPR
jgi:hypothetical protein